MTEAFYGELLDHGNGGVGIASCSEIEATEDRPLEKGDLVRVKGHWYEQPKMLVTHMRGAWADCLYLNKQATWVETAINAEFLVRTT